MPLDRNVAQKGDQIHIIIISFYITGLRYRNAFVDEYRGKSRNNLSCICSKH